MCARTRKQTLLLSLYTRMGYLKSFLYKTIGSRNAYTKVQGQTVKKNSESDDTSSAWGHHNHEDRREDCRTQCSRTERSMAGSGGFAWAEKAPRGPSRRDACRWDGPGLAG